MPFTNEVLKNVKTYYFGCIDQPGHYMFSSPKSYSLEDRRRTADFAYTNPWGTKIDGGLCSVGQQFEGWANLHHKDGWTALSFWDRSVDDRPGCNSNFLAEGDFSFDDMLSLARIHFPEVVNRLGFPIREAKS